MLKKTIKYVDYNENEREEDFYFNLSKAELTEMEMSLNGGLSVMLKRLVQEKNGAELIRILKEIILKAYGEKSDDGKHFRKGEDLSKSFSETEAYNSLFMEIVSSPESAMEFVKGLLPSDVREEINKTELEESKKDVEA